jgi:nucleoside-diphosphate-sugar epimerase
MRLLVTGGAGFIGSNLCEALLAEDHEVVAVDNFLTGHLENLHTLLPHPNFSFIECQTEDLPVLDLDGIFHLASPASPVGYGEHPLETLSANSKGTWRVLEVCRQTNASFLMASTSEIYGDPLEHPQKESYFGNVDPIGPRSCYDEGKRFAEALTVAYRQEYGVDTRIVRIFNCYGPRNGLQDGRMIPSFISQALQGEPITVFGDGSQTRSLCYVEDLVQGLTSALFTPGTCGGVYNLGNPDERSILEFAELVKALSGSNSLIIHKDSRPGEIAMRKPDITRAINELKWAPTIDVREGLLRTINWARTELFRSSQQSSAPA